MNSSFSAAAANACLLKNMENSNYPDYIGIESIEELLEIAKTKLDRSSPYVTHHISLLNDKKWIESLIELSKFGTVIIKRLPPILADFDAHILSLLKNDVAHPLSHYARYFINWWKCLDFCDSRFINNHQFTDYKEFRSLDGEQRQLLLNREEHPF